MPARKPRMLRGSAARVVSALAMRPARITRMSAVVSNGTTGSTSAPPTPQVIASRVTVARTPVRTARSVSGRLEETYIHAPRSSAVNTTAPAQPSSRSWGASGQASATTTAMRMGCTQTPSVLSRSSRSCSRRARSARMRSSVATAFSGRASFAGVVMGATCYDMTAKRTRVFLRHWRAGLGSCARTSRPGRRSVEIARQDQLQGDPVRRAGQSESNTGLDVQALGRMIGDPVELMGLLISGVELVQWSEIVVLLDGQYPRIGEIAGDSSRRREVQVFQAVVRGVENRIDDDVHRRQVPTEDRSNLRGEALRIPMPGVVTEFEIYAVEERTIIRTRHGEQEAQLDAIEHRAAMSVSRTDTVEGQIESRLEPRRYAVGPFGHPIQRFVGQEGAGKCRGRQAIGSEIGVQREIELAPRRQSAIVHLDLVSLCGDWLRNGHEREEERGGESRRSAHCRKN